MYPVLTREAEVSKEAEVYSTCIANIFTELWDLAMFSNVFTLINLTAESFIGKSEAYYK